MFNLTSKSLGVWSIMLTGSILFLLPHSADAQDNAGQEPTIKLLSEGSTPRRQLRYKYQPNRTQTMVMEMTMEMEISMGAQRQPSVAMPTTRTLMEIETQEVSAAGDVTYAFEITGVEVVPTEGVNPATAGTLQQQMSVLVGLKGTSTVDSRGLTKEGNVDVPEDVNPQLKSMLDNMQQSMQQMSSPLPEEAVGTGGSWEVLTTIENAMMTLNQTSTFTVEEMSENLVKLSVSINQSAPRQKVSPPGVPENVDVIMESLESDGTGTIELMMDSVIPKSENSLTTKNKVSVGPQTVETVLGVDMKIYPQTTP